MLLVVVHLQGDGLLLLFQDAPVIVHVLSRSLELSLEQLLLLDEPLLRLWDALRVRCHALRRFDVASLVQLLLLH